MKYLLVLFTLCLMSCGAEYNNKNTKFYIGKPEYPKVIYKDSNKGDIIQINDSIVIIFERQGTTKSNAKAINIKNFK